MRKLLSVMPMSLLFALATPSYAADFWPVGDRPAVVRPWSPPATPYGPGHRGVDLAALRSAPSVRALTDGRVSFAGELAGRGVIAVELADTGDPPLRTTYEPVTATVDQGDEVRAGDLVGVLELPTGHCPRTTPSCSTGACSAARRAWTRCPYCPRPHEQGPQQDSYRSGPSLHLHLSPTSLRRAAARRRQSTAD
ncbi:peptidoglycan DD-metalloendopeptidase family protein [Streptomyces sp. KL116D]|uniref:peptidoglycan DD-metalloendopeptidase family protein n=1 Tax=Streptomyces sp. KL116D TaxID=3045152 RepID=UPI00355793CA